MASNTAGFRLPHPLQALEQTLVRLGAVYAICGQVAAVALLQRPPPISLLSLSVSALVLAGVQHVPRRASHPKPQQHLKKYLQALMQQFEKELLQRRAAGEQL
jgi:hypothetical protein